MGSFDIVIVGGAVMGSAAAYWLTRFDPGCRVLVVERDSSYARSSTALSAASIRQQFSTEVNVRISQFGAEFLKTFSEEMDLDENFDLGFIQNGYLFLACSEQTATAMRLSVATQKSCGAGTELLSPTEVACSFPFLAVEDLELASFGPRDEGWFDNMGLLNGFRRKAIASGATFLKDEVVGLTRTGGRVSGVELRSGADVGAGVVINAAGPAAARVMGFLGEEIP
ncbi:MAG: FAD-binding oxidoreductase, partial [Rhodobacteraceae bacterium]|nr:FAD-binding oxidoreductase [Paracoccaceae bacterium]